MAQIGDLERYTAELPASLQQHRRLIRYRITSTDTLGASITGPYADDPQPNFAYYVYGDMPNWTGAVQPGVTAPVTYDASLLQTLPAYHLITTRNDHEDSQNIPNGDQGAYGGSDYLWQGALVYNGEVYDHIRYRARGGVWRYAMGKNMWKFDFNRGHEFEAVTITAAVRREVEEAQFLGSHSAGRLSAPRRAGAVREPSASSCSISPAPKRRTPALRISASSKTPARTARTSTAATFRGSTWRSSSPTGSCSSSTACRTATSTRWKGAPAS